MCMEKVKRHTVHLSTTAVRDVNIIRILNNRINWKVILKNLSDEFEI